MRSVINQRFLRIFLANILTSDLSPTDIRRLAQELDDHDVVRQLQKAIYELGNTLRQTETRQESRSNTGAEPLYDFIQRKRLSKIQVRERMRRIVPHMSFGEDADNMTMRELVQTFVNSGSNRASQFINQEGGDGQEDAFLKGIIARDKK